MPENRCVAVPTLGLRVWILTLRLALDCPEDNRKEANLREGIEPAIEGREALTRPGGCCVGSMDQGLDEIALAGSPRCEELFLNLNRGPQGGGEQRPRPHVQSIGRERTNIHAKQEKEGSERNPSHRSYASVRRGGQFSDDSRRPTDRALSCGPPVKGNDTSGGRPANRPPNRAAAARCAPQGERRRRVSCSALLGGGRVGAAGPKVRTPR